MNQKENIFQFVDLQRVDPPKKPLNLRKTDFVEIYEDFNFSQAKAQADRCLSCGNPYCQHSCPLHNNIPNWLRLVYEGRINEAADLASMTNSLPEVCGRVCPQDRLCEGSCTLNDEYGAVTIGAIEKYILEEALAQGWKPAFGTVETSGKKVAIVGAGPAGLGCVDILLREGVAVTVYEKQAEIGGLLTFGIPSFKLEKEIIQRRRKIFEEAGVEFKLGIEVGKDVSLKEIVDNYDAVFLAVGTYQGMKAGILNEDADGVYSALPFLIENSKKVMGIASDDYIDFKNKKVVVLGGGDTAMDCIRTSLRQGASAVTCVYRRDEANMPGSKKEVINAKEEGGDFFFNAQPVSIEVNEHHQVIGIKIVKTQLGEADASGRRSAEIIEGSEEILPCDAVIVAFGFTPHAMPWLNDIDVSTDSKGRIALGNALKQQTNNKKVFAGGDITRGSDLVVTAIKEGRDAAKSIIDYLDI